MRIVVLTNKGLMEELNCQGIHKEAKVEWIEEVSLFTNYPDADAWIDLLFKNDKERISLLKTFSKPVCINSVTETPDDPGFIRFNGWPTFLKRPVTEAAALNEEQKAMAEKIFSSFNRQVQWVPDEKGFISARVVVMIINEAYFALEEGVSTKEEIDIAMKLGTNHPYGPFEWSEKIGLENIYMLLSALGKTNPRYEPAPLLKKEAGK